MITFNYFYNCRLLRAGLANNEGVAYLETGETGLALQCFKQALTLLIDFECKNGITDVLTFKRDAVAIPAKIMDLQGKSSVCICNQAFLLDPATLLLRSEVDDISKSNISAIAMFNAALAYHQFAILLPKKEICEKVLYLYSTCIELVLKPSRQSSFAIALLAAATNNLAHAHVHFLAETDVAKKLLISLQETLSIWIKEPSLLAEESLKILCNLYFAEYIGEVAAAAA
jgi:tetratricopeptide (TPR) repeat protein